MNHFVYVLHDFHGPCAQVMAAQVLMGAAACRLVMLDHPQAEMSKELIHLPIAIQDTKVVQYM